MAFPPPSAANADGLLAAGGDLKPARLLKAYREGIFPWFNDDSLILWWSPDPRMVIYPDKIRVSSSMRKVIAKNSFELSRNKAFEQVVYQCAHVARKGQPGTWITREMQKAYLELHHHGYAVSYEAWQGGKLVGGLYGIDLGHIFCGESMFSLSSNASKFALISMAEELNEKGYKLIDCQVPNKHLQSMGAVEITREHYLAILRNAL